MFIINTAEEKGQNSMNVSNSAANETVRLYQSYSVQ
jgi:hypothetical protein